MKQTMTCIVCPIGCQLQIDQRTQPPTIEGNQCPRGATYALQELTHPTRILTTTVKIHGALYPRLPVMSAQAIPKEQLLAVMEALSTVEVHAPIQVRDVIVANVCGLGIDVVASRSMAAIQV